MEIKSVRLAAKKTVALLPETASSWEEVICPLTNEHHGSIRSTGRHQHCPCLAEFSPDSLGGKTSVFPTLVSSYFMAQLGEQHPCQDQPATDNPTTGAPTDKRAFWTGKVWASPLTISILLLRPTHCTLKHLIFLWLLP